ncbi:peptide-methionine (S)-S-oxide reductase MsrA [Pedobacter cryophilus]|uniref:Peptide methionine sulfoxide reductase MsrA n=1 Tax=Pedobacter cryophilus TaxID=2571271 RepID=A0A4U1C191_9SPHI|nr:peptide-methionine (S)-S-oxide reductase MsrA [Pedobacter cryophilus]TKB98727.1 peptide-methionine (S)-S-oxide reductase MsrA [Pedobacter cryophilus]
MTQKGNFGGGCFWCTEAVFTAVNGVEKVTSGYMGGQVDNPTYEQVCTGTTGHAEIIQIEFDPAKVSFQELLLIFFKTHDATTLNRQGADVGTQYRSVVFYETEEQKIQTEEMITQLNVEKVFSNPIVTEVSAVEQFYPAEKYHQDYFINHRSQGYCMAVIEPKLAKFAANFRDKIKPELL